MSILEKTTKRRKGEEAMQITFLFGCSKGRRGKEGEEGERGECSALSINKEDETGKGQGRTKGKGSRRGQGYKLKG